jgi:phosphate transport system permease protein
LLRPSTLPQPTSPRVTADGLFRLLCRSAAVLVLVLAAGLVTVLLVESWPFLRAAGPGFLVDTVWDRQGRFGALPFVFGTLATSFLAMLIAVPLGVGCAAYLAEIAPGWLRRAGSFLIELLAAIPSVVYGFWGLCFLAPAVQAFFDAVGGPNTGGTGILAASLILAIMVVPYIAAVGYDACRAVPQSQREGALALGATRWQTIRTVVLPYARPGVVAACFLALGRALGETMAVTMLIGNDAVLPHGWDWFRFPFRLGHSIASVIANELNEADSDLYRSALVALGLVLFLVTVLVNSLARLLIRRVGRPVRRTGDTRHETRERPVWLVSRPRWARLIDRVMSVTLAGCLGLVLGLLFLILGYIVFRGLGSLNWDFFTKLPAPPRPTGESGVSGGGMAHALGGSALLVSLATLFAVPVGILAAVYLAEYRGGALGGSVRFVGELLGGVPSIVLGIYAYALLVGPTRTFSAWAGAFALAVMMIPIVLRSAEEAMKLVPQGLRDASYALGAGQWQTVLRVRLPAALSAVITGVFLAVGRIAGETAPLLLTAYGSNFWPRWPGDRTPFLPKYIFDYSRSGYPDWERQAWAAALVLLAVVMVLNVGIRLLTGRRVVAASRAD